MALAPLLDLPAGETSTAWLVRMARARGRLDDLQRGQAAFAAGCARPSGRWEAFGWQDARISAARAAHLHQKAPGWQAYCQRCEQAGVDPLEEALG